MGTSLQRPADLIRYPFCSTKFGEPGSDLQPKELQDLCPPGPPLNTLLTCIPSHPVNLPVLYTLFLNTLSYHSLLYILLPVYSLILYTLLYIFSSYTLSCPSTLSSCILSPDNTLTLSCTLVPVVPIWVSCSPDPTCQG